MKKNKITKEEYWAALLKDIYEVCFEKKDGTFRIIRCTLRPDLVPKTIKEIEREKAKAKRRESENSLSVWDLEMSAWRSFRIESIATFKKIS